MSTFKDTATLDQFYLEWSQFTNARNHREVHAKKEIDLVRTILEKMVEGDISSTETEIKTVLLQTHKALQALE